MKKYRYFAPALIILAVIAISLARSHRADVACSSETALMMDTLVEVKVWATREAQARVGVDSALAVIGRQNAFLGDALVESGRDKAVLASPLVADLLAVSETVNRLTGGMFDPTIGSVSRLWGFGEDAALPNGDSLRGGLAHVGLARFLSAPDSDNFMLDLGGVAKGNAVGLAARKLASLGFRSAIVSAGGDMRLVGKRPDGKPWHIAIRHPRKEGAFIGFLDLVDVAVATSGDYERCFMLDGVRYHHILDPRTGMPGRACASVTVVGKDGALCDALATGLFLMGPRQGFQLAESLEGVEAVFVYADGESLLVTGGLEGRFTRADLE